MKTPAMNQNIYQLFQSTARADQRDVWLITSIFPFVQFPSRFSYLATPFCFTTVIKRVPEEEEEEEI